MQTRNVCLLVAMGSAMAATTALGVRGEREASAEPQAPKTAPSEVSPTTRQAKLRMILRDLHAVNQRETEAAKLAAERAKSQEVKDFASEMERDHQADDEKLQELARKRHLSLTAIAPADPIHAADRAALDAHLAMLKEKQGAAFDATYLGPQSLVHEMALQAIDRGLALAPQTGEEHELLEQVKGSVTMHRDHALRLVSRLVLPPIGIGGGASETREPPREHDRHAGAEPLAPSTGGGPTEDAGAAATGDAQAFPPERVAPTPDHEQPPAIEDHVESPER